MQRRAGRRYRWILWPTLSGVAAAAVFVLAFSVYLIFQPTVPETPHAYMQILPAGSTFAGMGEARMVARRMETGFSSAGEPSRGSIVALVGWSPPKAENMNLYMMMASIANPSDAWAMRLATDKLALCFEPSAMTSIAP
jgi:hypothetical protein